jgi:uncharacterized delta-60 repeat protein
MMRSFIESFFAGKYSRRTQAHCRAGGHIPAVQPLESRVLLSAGELDLSFGNSGRVVTEFEESNTWSNVVLASAIQQDGRIIAVGEGAIARYLPDGSLDVSFGVGGKAGFPNYARGVAVQANGSIVVVGGSASVGSENFVVARYLANGTLDSSFSEDGIVVTDFGANETAYDVAVQSNGRILVVGGNGEEIAIACYTSTGALDNTFDGDGRFLRRFNTNRTDTAHAVAIQADGRIVVAGTTWVSYSISSSNHDFFVMRLNSNGTTDNSFGGTGYLNTNFGRADDARDLLIQPDGRIVVSGSAQISFREHLAIARYNSDGTLDTTFDGDGRLQMQAPGSLTNNDSGVTIARQSDGGLLTGTSGYVYRFDAAGQLDTSFNGTGRSQYLSAIKSLAVQSDGRILAGGFNNRPFSLARLTATGQIDNTFSSDGLVWTQFGPSVDEASASSLQTDGKLVVVGRSQGNFSVARYLPNGSPDLSFSQDGRTTISFGAGYLESGAADVAIQPDGKILIVGSATRIAGLTAYSDIAMARLNSDGTPDNSFSQDGLVTTDLGGNSGARSVALLADGKFMIGGFAGQGSFTIARYRADGTLDTSFRGTGFATHFVVSNGSSTVTSIVVQPDGKVLAVGNIQSSTTNRYRTTVSMVRYNANGSIDSTFGANGRLIDSFNDLRVANDVKVLADGSILVSGSAEWFGTQGRNSSLAVSKYDSSGAATGFGTVVRAIEQPYVANLLRTYTAVADAKSLLVQPNGKILIGGETEGRFTLWRINSDGSNDTSFSGDGRVSTEFPDGTATLVDVQRQADGRLIAVGTLISPVTQRSADRDFLVTRYRDVTPPAFSTNVRIGSSGQMEITDLWGRDDNWSVTREGDSVIVQDHTGDSQVRFQVVGLSTIQGNGTNRIVIPVELITATGKPLALNGMAGNDYVSFASESDLAPLQGVSFRGGAGDDTFSQAGSALPASWYLAANGTGYVVSPGRQGRGFASVERLIGGWAQDTFVVQAATSATVTVLEGGSGTSVVDTLIVSGNADITLTNNAARISGAINQQLAAGGFEAADLRGGEGSNVLNARDFPGPVKLNGFGGDDALYGGQFDDTLNGSDGNDFVFGGDGNDLLSGGTGHDALNGDYGDDRLFGNDGSDILVGGFGTDLLYGGNGQDILIGGLTTYLYLNSAAADRVAVLTAWASSDPYATKVEKLGTQGIQSGTTLLKLTPLLTVFNDLSVDTLFGQADLDWFFASQTQSFNEVNIAQGGLRDRALGEVLTPLL